MIRHIAEHLKKCFPNCERILKRMNHTVHDSVHRIYREAKYYRIVLEAESVNR